MALGAHGHSGAPLDRPLILVPMTTPSLLSAIAWIQLLDPRIGLINVVLRSVSRFVRRHRALRYLYALRHVFRAGLAAGAVGFSHDRGFVSLHGPFFGRTKRHGRARRRPDDFSHHPADHAPGAARMFIYYVIVVIEAFDIPGLLGFTASIRVLSTAIYWATHSEVGLPDYGLASALGALVLGVALLLMWFYQRLTAHQERFTTITGKGYRPRQINLGAWTVPATALCVVYVALAVVLPFLMLLWTSLQPFYAVPSADSLARITFEGYFKIWHESTVMRALWNTMVLALVTSAATILLALMVSWFVVRRTARGRRLVALSCHGLVPAAVRAEHRHRLGVYFCLRALSAAALRDAVDYRSGDDDPLSRLQLAHHDLGADAGARRAGRSFADVARAVGAHAAENHHAAFGAGHDQRVFLGGGACDAGALDGADALQSGHRRGLDDDLEHVAKRPDRGCGGLGVILIMLSAILLLGGQLFRVSGCGPIILDDLNVLGQSGCYRGRVRVLRAHEHAGARFRTRSRIDDDQR